jgi:uncharacterized protein (TIGR02246 family)
MQSSKFATRDMTCLVARAWRQTLILTCAVSLLAIAPTRAEDRSVLRREIEAMHVRYLDAFNHRDAAALSALFAENAIFIDPAGKVASGRNNIERMFSEGFRDGDLMLEASADQIGTIGDGAWDVGHGALKSGGGTQRLPLHYATIYVRQGGALKLRVVSVGGE